ncbi:MAG: DNA polymerase III subunits gamma and tau [Bacteroidetes bacterium]|nr:MAG: DNA polymerase III subunits gamma and tau [Bacteroidota bacterium]
MENFIVSARKYRPATFDTVVGQSPITTTLKNAIRNNHLAQAFLFCGPRGVGKTTCARILAKTINCTNLTADTEACDTCESCKSFNDGQAIDIMELDAASNNSVDDIRNLVDTVRIPPQLMENNPNAKKVYVIDEVHMLSAAAFNAFLKTLEEPPRYAIFILATTERHKILPTILSRCQIFNFNRIQVDDIANHLAYIAKSENVNAEPDALHVIAQKADGALRDACSIFDQVVTFAGNNVTYKAVIENLNVLDYDYYFRVTDHILTEDIPQALLTFNEVLNNGFDGHVFIAGLAEHLRNLLVCKDAATIQLLEVGQNIREKYKEQSARCAQPLLLRALNLVNRCDIGYKSARNPRLLVEFTLMQLCSLNSAGGDAEKKNDSIIPVLRVNKDVSGKLSQEALVTTQMREVEKPVSTEEKIAAAVSNKTDINSNTGGNPVHVPANNPAVANSGQQKAKFKSSSISSFTATANSKAEEQQTVVAEMKSAYGLPETAFSEEQLTASWNEFAQTVKVKSMSDYTALTMPRKLLEGFRIELSVANATQAEEMERLKTDLLQFLRKQLNNSSISLSVIVNKVDDGRKLYTDQEKYTRMVEINPNLEKLRKQFDLNLD